ncbi:SDR family oxidoreductase [Caenimonas aquaedulcis]|uniref:SDR family oxidoreductase n=1 Tax=Caenimonas aquaedulcis TaxID=2793270 RepID=A0A931H7C0_9BURK|nr:SDR family oxidoreductase [Caenimonas aquaedulcis]MBG9389878.1 SDR family oxidoreductase [Caenimonas aquaedulcis]
MEHCTDLPLRGKVAVVTGAARGIGRAIAQTLGRQGASVLVNYSSNSGAAEEVVNAIRAHGSRAEAARLHLDGPRSAAELFAAAQAAFGRVDILVLNAASARFGPVTSVTEADFDAMYAVNVKAAFFCFQEAAKHLANGGRIVSISAALTSVGYDNTMMYAGTKGALEQFTLAAAKELGKRGIVCNSVSPGATHTDLYHGLAPEAAREAAKQRSPFKRLAEPQDIADLVAFLASDAARWVSGQNIRANGAALW